MSLYLQPVHADAFLQAGATATGPEDARMAYEFRIPHEVALSRLMLVTGTGSDQDGHCTVAGWYNSGTGRCEH